MARTSRDWRRRAAATAVLVACASTSSAFQAPPASTGGLASIPRHQSAVRPVFDADASVAPSSRSSPQPTSLRALPAAVSTLASPLGSASVLAFVVLVHELGHFIAARSLGITVREFSVGVGPKLAGFTRRPKDATVAEDGEDEEGIDFSFRAVPLGGYVRFPENYNATLAYEIEQENREIREEERESKKLEAEANGVGKAGGLLGALNLNFKSGKEEEEEARRRLEEQKQLEEESKPSWKNFFGLTSPSPPPAPRVPREIEYYNDPNLLQNRPWQQRALVLSGGVAFNIALAFACYFGELTVGDGLPKPVFDQGAVVTQAPRADGAAQGILRRGDVIIGVNGIPLSRSAAPKPGEAQEDISKFISSIRANSPGDSLSLSILRTADGESAEFAKNAADILKTDNSGSKSKPVKVTTPMEVTVQPRPLADGPMSIGVMLSPNYVRTDLVKAENPVDAAVKAGGAVAEVTSQTARSILELLGGILMGKGTGGQSVSGPIGVLKAGSDVVSTNDARAVVAFAAAISINLAVINSLPLPALDGGQLAFVLAEGVSGRKIDQRVQENINFAVVLLLLAVSVSTTVGDVQAIAFGR
eukprot:CAMPEP_0183301714 /NCGR_PEP_ID=MMETSP0160_2-20130417/7737_1 /TAXON_ID=2839 ORGANISM="Odontella Sinensis, Strain Grunow 1884" /NCGR_SAMPLE_ID=MMETSP0160_2 /ASSEMBLY_ACC=CAM_ASM_000250 /LENGTH=589 /DNA_ID=CAMNT_0025464383 /DNA_START=35 /DNA_END=1804 /DNA_ORIENTATION=-